MTETRTAPELAGTRAELSAPASGWKGSLAGGLLREARPKQWVKNVLVFAAPAAAGALSLSAPAKLGRTLLAFVAFSLAASGTYFLNDARDVEADRMHPKKCRRPIAAGIVPLWLGYTVGVGLLLLSVVMSWLLVNPGLAAAIAVYVTITTSYSIWLKHVPILDIVLVAAGFVVRAIGGGLAAPVRLSQWFLIVASFASLFMVAGKRHAEHMDLGDDAGSHRRTLEAYTPEFLNHVRTTSSAVTILAYCLWAFEKGGGSIWFSLSVAPFVVALYRYAMRVEAGHGGAPEEVVLGDRFLQVAGLVWAALFAIGVYLK